MLVLGLLLGGSSDEEDDDVDANSDCSDEDRWAAPAGDEDEELVAGLMEGDGLPTPVGARGAHRSSSGRQRRRSTAATQDTVAETVEEAVGTEGGQDLVPQEIQLPEECWVEILRSGGVREMCTMGRINR